MVSVPSLFLDRRTSRKESWLSFSSSLVKRILSVVVLIVCNVLFNCPVLTMAIMLSTYVFQKVMSSLSAIALFSRSGMTASARKLERGELMGVPDMSVKCVLESEFSI